ncbi:unnamed protein product (macronuclear) [Paramecium tetraurelia]|uniref:EGF-like domain-containing protein n=1 Tax=Paramecium tetraurelia TaxID=5888 RepID=A0CEQ4_PARTE|nr:uncharacterized protein GSPATT00037710001 [Paramecium tetraurelia]CAK69271.1 unnamed protein product [Paramecium tetraurelia]|eukprot:XP_001436668.1 hypothetical protein (macronuclear) [Paramecium tetraurelia strain d4-2]
MIYLVLILLRVSDGLDLGEIPCNQFNNEGSCKQSGYCQWSGQCYGQHCHLIDEVAACRNAGIMTLYCVAVPYMPLQYAQTCYENTSSGLKTYYSRFVSDLTIDVIQQTSILFSDLINGERSITNMLRLYNLDVLSRQNDELNQILDLYISFAELLITQYSHPYYLERIMYESIQNIRDDTQLNISKKRNTMIKILEILDIYYLRLKTFSEFYQTQYNFINFNQVHLKYLQLQYLGQATITWTEYESNGMLQVTVLYAEIFGKQSPMTPIYIIRTSNNINLQYKLKCYFNTFRPVALKQINLITMKMYETFVQPQCSSGYCEVDLQGAGNYLFVDMSKVDQCNAIQSITTCVLANCVVDLQSRTCH